MRFVALDLETTGLSPITDTIIEIAAIRFEIEKKDGIYLVKNSEERTMLVDPERPLSDEVSMITGIRSEMLEGREKWGDVRERVEKFIGDDTIIVGHNVLFDIAMLKTHGIDLSGHTVLDTFELSEIFSQDAESLNLLFLAKKYELPIDGEHRALDDTRLSVGLFIQYLGMYSNCSEKELSIFAYFKEKDEYGIISCLSELTEVQSAGSYILPYDSKITKNTIKHTFHTGKNNAHIHSLDVNTPENLSQLIKEILNDGKKITLITNGKKQSQYWYNYLSQEKHTVELLIDTKRYCSIRGLSDMMNQKKFQRKELIFILKMAFWLGKTSTGLLDELKYYGDEHMYIEYLRSPDNEYTSFREEQEKKIKNATMVIGDMWMQELRTDPIFDTGSTTLITDIGEIEDIFRKSESKKIRFSSLFSYLDDLYRKNIIAVEFYDACIRGVSYIKNLVERIPNRPTGADPLPPGDYGETYYFDQSSLWHHGEKWLSIYTDILFCAIENEKVSENTNSLDKRKFDEIISQIRTLIDISSRKDTNIGMILTIQEDDTCINIIPRDVKAVIQRFFSVQGGDTLILTGYGINGPIVSRFLSEQCGVEGIDISPVSRTEKALQVQTNIKNTLTSSHSCLIVTGSNKHARILAQEIKKIYPERVIFTQGISGGKGKMLSLFSKEKEDKVLIGLIDSWMEEYELFHHIDTLILAKVPFDPPTDPYYLARTVGMRNNFEEYSCPIAINTVNSLIGKVREVNPDTKIYCIDERLRETLWGQKIFDEIL